MKNKYLSARVRRVPRLCPIFRAQPGACPPEAQNRTLRRRAGEQEIRPKTSAAASVEKGNAAEWTRPTACGKCGKTLKMVKIEGFWTLRRESRTKPQGRARPAAVTSARRAGSFGDLRGRSKHSEKQPEGVAE